MTIINDLITQTDANDPTWRPANANESVHYHHCNYDESCHGCIDRVTVNNSGVSVEWSLCPLSWVPSQGRRNDLITRTDANDPTWCPTNANRDRQFRYNRRPPIVLDVLRPQWQQHCAWIARRQERILDLHPPPHTQSIVAIVIVHLCLHWPIVRANLAPQDESRHSSVRWHRKRDYYFVTVLSSPAVSLPRCSTFAVVTSSFPIDGWLEGLNWLRNNIVY